MQNNSRKRYRERMITATMNRIQRKAGGMSVVMDTSGGKLRTIEITIDTLQFLLDRFEAEIRELECRADCEAVIDKAYMLSVEINRDNFYLSDTGKTIMDDLISEYVKGLKHEKA